MSHDANKWEADIRQAVETHEFGYDPKAWAAMEQMLDGAGGGNAAPGSGRAGLAWGWKVLLFLLLGTIVLLLWWYWPARQTTPPLPSRTETPAQTALSPQTIAPPAAEEELFTPALKKPSGTASPGQQTMAPLPPLPDAEAPLLSPPIREEQLRPRWPVPPRLPARPPAMLESPDTLPLELELLQPEPGKRRRNRRTLFPDVIEKY